MQTEMGSRFIGQLVRESLAGLRSDSKPKRADLQVGERLLMP
jgi:hypothetical protein